MAHKTVRLALVDRDEAKFWGFSPIPCIHDQDTVEFVTATLNATLTFHDKDELFSKFKNLSDPAMNTFTITPEQSKTLTATDEVDLRRELRKSNVTVTANRDDDGSPVMHGQPICVDGCDGG